MLDMTPAPDDDDEMPNVRSVAAVLIGDDGELMSDVEMLASDRAAIVAALRALADAIDVFDGPTAKGLH